MLYAQGTGNHRQQSNLNRTECKTRAQRETQIRGHHKKTAALFFILLHDKRYRLLTCQIANWRCARQITVEVFVDALNFINCEVKMKTRLQSGSVSGILSSVAITCTTVSMVCLVASGVANATPLILNGGFESGFTSWTRVNQLGSEGAFFLQTGTLSPVNGDPVPAPPSGVFAAMTDALGPGSHV